MPLPYTYFVKTTTIVGAASDANDGRDPLGCALSNATYDHTGGGSGERQLTAASGTPFANVQAGDYIYLVNAAGGVADGLYEIASVPSNTVILLEADSGLTADSTGDVDSSDGPWATLQYSLDTATSAAGDFVVWCDDGDGTGTDWEPTVTLDVDTTGSIGANGRSIYGANSRGVVDGTVTTISGASSSASLITTAGGSVDLQKWYDLRFTGATGSGIDMDDATGYNGWCFTRCRFDNNSSYGVNLRTAAVQFFDCELDNNNHGAGDTSNNGGCMYHRCRIHDNTNDGIEDFAGLFVNCLIYDNGAVGVRCYRSGLSTFLGCVFFGNGSHGIASDTSSPSGNTYPGPIVYNCVFRSNGGYGISWTYSQWGTEVDYCCFSNNTSGTINGTTLVAFLGRHPNEDNNIYVDPQFTSETDGSEDFTPATGSPLIDAGIQVPAL